MAQVNGTLMTVYYDTGDTDTLILSTTDCTLNVNQDLPSTMNKGSGGWQSHINGAKDWSIDFSGMYESAGTGETTDELIAIIIAGTAAVTFAFGTSADKATGWNGSGTLANMTIDAPTEGPATCSGSIIGTGALEAI